MPYVSVFAAVVGYLLHRCKPSAPELMLAPLAHQMQPNVAPSSFVLGRKFGLFLVSKRGQYRPRGSCLAAKRHIARYRSERILFQHQNLGRNLGVHFLRKQGKYRPRGSVLQLGGTWHTAASKAADVNIKMGGAISGCVVCACGANTGPRGGSASWRGGRFSTTAPNVSSESDA